MPGPELRSKCCDAPVITRNSRGGLPMADARAHAREWLNDYHRASL